jgi:3-oxoacyl-[acyl-carrier-protein] synthase II
MTSNNEVWITGIGLISSIGEGCAAHWQALTSDPVASPVIDSESIKPYSFHPLIEPDWASQISRRDKRQMEPWMQIGSYAAGLALDDAGVKGNEEYCSTMDMIVAAGGGERDIETDGAIHEDSLHSDDPDALLNERLSNDLRPTLFLAQLSNLLAGNISIVHKVTGSSRTFMGEESAGISAIQTAAARIRSGQSDHVLVGGAYNGGRRDMMLTFELGHYLWSKSPEGVAARANSGNGGIILGSVGIFLVLESRKHAVARGKQPYAKIDNVTTDHGSRGEGEAAKRGKVMLECLNVSNEVPVLSAATSISDIYNEEMQVLGDNATVRCFGNQFGHAVEAQFPLGVALAALSVSNGSFYPPFEKGERDSTSSSEQILVSCFGHWRGEGLAVVSNVKTKG